MEGIEYKVIDANLEDSRHKTHYSHSMEEPKSESEHDVPWHSGDPFQHPIPSPGGDPWGICLGLSREYDEKNCDAWREEVDKLLIFAGLFSAAVTAFTIESYKMLQQDPQDTTVQLLAQVVAQLSIINGQNSTSVPIVLPASSSQNLSAVRINIFWFLSLTLSLSTVLIGILCMQWLREYERGVSLPSKDAIALRQMRYEGFLWWHVTGILQGLPLLLQAALVFFFAGLLDLLWQLNTQVAAVITVVVTITMFFLVATTVLPTLQYALTRDRHFRVPQCPYKSPQSWAFHRLGLTLLALGSQISQYIQGYQPRDGEKRRIIYQRLLKRISDWLHFDIYLLQLRDAGDVRDGEPVQAHALVNRDVARGLAWVAETFVQSSSAVYAVSHCLRDLRSQDIAATLEVIQPAWTLPDELRKTIDDSVYMDLLCAHALEQLCFRNRQLRPALAFHRFELYVRINDAIRGRFPTGLICPIRIWDVQIIPLEFKIKVLKGIATLLLYTGSEGDLDAAWFIIEPLLKDPHPAPPALQRAIQAFFLAQVHWISQPPSPSPSPNNSTKHERTKDCLRHLVMFCYGNQRLYHALKSRFPLLLPSFLALVRSVNESIGELGYPEYWTPWAARQWQDFVAGIAPELTADIEFRLDSGRPDRVDVG